MAFKTEYDFELPVGYVDQESGEVHKKITMRMATAGDEILPQKDPRVQSNPAYLTVILLSRVITKLGGLSSVTPNVIENIYTADLAFLQDKYKEINELNIAGAKPGE